MSPVKLNTLVWQKLQPLVREISWAKLGHFCCSNKSEAFSSIELVEPKLQPLVAEISQAEPDLFQIHG